MTYAEQSGPLAAAPSVTRCRSRVAAGGVEAKGAGDPLQLDRADLDEGHRYRVDDLHHVLAHHDLARSGVLCDPRRDVHGASEVVALLEQDRSRVEPDVGRRQPSVGCALDHVERSEDPDPGSGKKNITPSPSHLTGLPP